MKKFLYFCIVIMDREFVEKSQELESRYFRYIEKPLVRVKPLVDSLLCTIFVFNHTIQKHRIRSQQQWRRHNPTTPSPIAYAHA